MTHDLTAEHALDGEHTFEDHVQEGVEGVFRVGAEDGARKTGGQSREGGQASTFHALTRRLEDLSIQEKEHQLS